MAKIRSFGPCSALFPVVVFTSGSFLGAQVSTPVAAHPRQATMHTGSVGAASPEVSAPREEPVEEPTQEPIKEPTKEVVRDEVVVAVRREAISVADSPIAATVLSKAQIEMTAGLALDESLSRVASFGLFRRNSSAVAQPTTQGVSLRNIGPSGASRTLVLLDEAPLNDPFGGWVYWSRVAADDVETAEVVRGGGSTVWGSGALGGVIQLWTRRPVTDQLRVRLDGGERATARASVSADVGIGSWRAGLTGEFFDTGGYPTLRADQRGAIDEAARSEHGLFDLRALRVAKTSEVRARAQWFSEDRGNGTRDTDNGTELAYASVVAQWEGAGSWVLQAHGQDQEFDATFSSQAADRNSETPALDQFKVPTTEWGTFIRWSRPFALADSSERISVVQAGFDVSESEGETNELFFLSGGTFLRQREAGGRRLLAGLFAEDSMNLGRLQVDFGVRFDRFERRAGRREEFVIATGAPLRSDAFADSQEGEWSPRLGLVLPVGVSSRLRAAAYRAFRAPTLNELYRPFRVRNDITEANPALRSEELEGAEIGWSGSGRKWNSAATFYWDQLDDPVANVTLAPGPGVIAPCGFVPAGGVCRQRQNLGRARVQGVEGQAEWRPNTSWSLGFDALWSEAEVTSAPQRRDLEGRRLAQTPEWRAAGRVEWTRFANFQVTVAERFVDEQFEDDANSLLLADGWTTDLMARWVSRGRWDIFATVENVFDETLEAGRTADGLVTIAAPRLIRVGLRWHR